MQDELELSLSVNLSHYRKTKELARSELAQLTKMSVSTYTKIETGELMPDEEQLGALVNLLGVSRAALFQDVPESLLQQFDYYKSTNLARRLESMTRAQGVLRGLVVYQDLEETLGERNANVFESFDETDPVKAAAVARKILGMRSDQDLRELVSLLEVAGIKVFFFAGKDLEFAGGGIAREHGGPLIAVNEAPAISLERRLYTLAFELGRLILPQAKSGSQKADELYRSFASHFLMPQLEFKRIWTDFEGLIFSDRVLSVKQYFCVSYVTVLARLDEEGYSSDLWAVFQKGYLRWFGKTLVDYFPPYNLPIREPKGSVAFELWNARSTRLVRRGLLEGSIPLMTGCILLGLSEARMKDLLAEWGAEEGLFTKRSK